MIIIPILKGENIMAKKSKLAFEFACENCGYVPQIDEDKSTENWNVIPTKCTKCGGKIKIKL